MNVTQKQVCEDIVELLTTLKNAMLDIAEEQGITRIQLFALHAIERQGELAMGQVAEVLHCDPSNITGMVDRMVSQGLLTRQECATDRRAKTLRLTAKGNQIVAVLHAELPARIGCDKLSQTQLNDLHGLIQTVCA